MIHCTGYLKSWSKIGLDDVESETEDPCNLSCLVAVGRILSPITIPSPSIKYRPITFISRHAIDGKFVFVDQRYFLTMTMALVEIEAFYQTFQISCIA